MPRMKFVGKDTGHFIQDKIYECCMDGNELVTTDELGQRHSIYEHNDPQGGEWLDENFRAVDRPMHYYWHTRDPRYVGRVYVFVSDAKNADEVHHSATFTGDHAEKEAKQHIKDMEEGI